MPAEIKVETFPFTRYGLIHATVISVSNDAVIEDHPQQSPTDQKPGTSDEQHYIVKLALVRDTINIDGKWVRLTPGMAVTAEVMTAKRRVISYVLSPLARATREAGRER